MAITTELVGSLGGGGLLHCWAGVESVASGWVAGSNHHRTGANSPRGARHVPRPGVFRSAYPHRVAPWVVV